MARISDLIDVHPAGEDDHGFEFTCGCGKLSVDDGGGGLTAYGGAAAWSHFLQRIGLVEDMAARFPLRRTSPNATPVRDVLHAFMFNCLLGGKRFSHARRMQDDGVAARILGLEKERFCGEDAFPRLISRLEPAQLRTWMSWTERDIYAALPDAFIADWDSTVNTRYGRQEDVAVGYNPHKPGRGSHHPLLCVVAGTRLALHMEWRRGDTVSATGWREAMERIWSHPSVRHGLKLNRGDIGFAQEKIMAWHEEKEEKRPFYLFKLKLTRNVRRAINAIPWPHWEGQPSVGMEQYAESMVKLQGWSCARRVVFVRRLKPVNPSVQDLFWGMAEDEVEAYVTSLPPQEASGVQILLLYRKRADAENVFDELKNQWGFRGFCSQRAVVSEAAARLVLLTYNLWSMFVRVLKEDGCHTEAIKSRDELLLMPAKLVASGRQRTLKMSVGKKWWAALSQAYTRLQRWLCRTAPQLDVQQTIENYLGWHSPLNPENWLGLPPPSS